MKDTFPVTFFIPLSKSLTALFVTTLGLCSDLEPPNSVNLNDVGSYPYKLNMVFILSCTRHDYLQEGNNYKQSIENHL